MERTSPLAEQLDMDLACENCGARNMARVYRTLNMETDQDVIKEFLTFRVFAFDCSDCGRKRVWFYPLRVMHPAHRFSAMFRPDQMDELRRRDPARHVKLRVIHSVLRDKEEQLDVERCHTHSFILVGSLMAFFIHSDLPVFWEKFKSVFPKLGAAAALHMLYHCIKLELDVLDRVPSFPSFENRLLPS